MSDEQRAKLNTKIEREVHKFVQTISENLYDRLNLYVRRNDLPIERDVLEALLKTMQASITEFEMNRIDHFHAAIKNELDAYLGEESTSVEAPKPTKKGGPKQVTVTGLV